MPISFPEIRKFSGLYLQANSFDVPDGAMEVCSNVEIQSDAILSKTHGWYTYYTSPLNNPIRTMVTYQNYLIMIGNDVRYINTFDQISPDEDYSPQYNAVVLTGESYNPLDPYRTAEQNNNLYFTTGSGIFRLEAYNSTVQKAGVPPALDLKAMETGTASGPLPANSETGYRILFGRRDANGNLLLSSPSDIAYVGFGPTGTGLSYSSTGPTPFTVTVTTTSPHLLVVGDQIVVTNASDTDANGTQTVSATPTALTFQFRVVNNPTGGTLDYTFSRQATLEFSIPSEINDATFEWFYQVYRTTSSAGADVSPSPDFALAAEVNLTQTDLDLGYILYTDTVDSSLLGAQLYTNPNTREGELQANARPPLAQDIQLYKNYMLYANVSTKQRLFLNLVNPAGIAGGNFVIFVYNSVQESYLAVSGAALGNKTTAASVAGITNVVITYANHGASTGWTVDIEAVTGSVPRGTYTITASTVNTFTIVSTGNTATAITFSFLTNGTFPVFFSDQTSSSVGVQVANTAYALVKAINRNSAYMYANYTSTFDDNPGQIRIELKAFDATNTNLFVRLQTNSPQPFIPPLPTSFLSGVQVSSQNDVLPDTIFVSKIGEPEAVPIVNFFRAGAKQKAIRRIFTLRDSVIILKEDGIFKLTGDTIDQFSITIIDGTVLVDSSKGADTINNSVMALSNQGLVSISETSVQIISRRIDDPIQPIVGLVNVDVFASFGYESGRTWYFCQTDQRSGIAPITYMFNVLNQSWTTTDVIFQAMALGPDGTIYAVQGQENTKVLRQRKSFNLVDYSNEFAVGTAQATGTNTVYAVMVSGNIFVPLPGDVVLYNQLINRITSVAVNGIGYDLTFVSATTIPGTGDAVNFYQGFTSDMTFAPFHAGQVGREKQFSQFQLHLRQNMISDLLIDFANESIRGSGITDWQAQLVTQSTATAIEGWGDGPWGLFEWGSTATSGNIQIVNGTYPSLIIRTYIPLFASRSTFIKAILSNRQACEPLLIQSLSYAVHGYSERVTR